MSTCSKGKNFQKWAREATGAGVLQGFCGHSEDLGHCPNNSVH